MDQTRNKQKIFGYDNLNRLTSYGNLTVDTEWQTRLSTGLSFDVTYFPRKFLISSKQIFVCDLNGDGKDDFYAVDYTPAASTMPAVKRYLGYDNDRNFQEYSGANMYGLDKWIIQPIDSRGDGRHGFIASSVHSGPSMWNGYQLFMPVTDLTDMVKTITDSYGNSTTISYKNMTDASVYSKTHFYGDTLISGYDCLSFTAPLKLVSGVMTGNGIGGSKEMTYKYENAKVMKRGRGMLGFTKFIKTDVSNSLQTTVTQEFSNTYYEAAVKEIEEKKTSTNRVLKKTEIINSLRFPSGTSSFQFAPTSVSTKEYEPNSNIAILSSTTSYTYDSYGNVNKETVT